MPFGFGKKPDVEALKKNKDVDGLIKALGYQKDIPVRWEAAAALGTIGDKRAVEPLIGALKDSSYSVQGEVSAKAADRLLEIYKTRPEGFVQGARGSREDEIRDIGRLLSERGGFELMRRTHEEFSSKCLRVGVRGARNLEYMWDGIGGWQG